MYEPTGNALQGAGLQNAQYLNQCTASSPVQPNTVALEIQNRLEQLHSQLRDIRDSQKSLIERLHGTCPEKSSAGEACATPTGMLALIDERLKWLNAIISDIYSNQERLSKLA